MVSSIRSSWTLPPRAGSMWRTVPRPPHVRALPHVGGVRGSATGGRRRHDRRRHLRWGDSSRSALDGFRLGEAAEEFQRSTRFRLMHGRPPHQQWPPFEPSGSLQCTPPPHQGISVGGHISVGATPRSHQVTPADPSHLTPTQHSKPVPGRNGKCVLSHAPDDQDPTTASAAPR